MSEAEASVSPGSWSRLKALAPYLVTGLLFAAGIYALYHLLKPVEFRDVMDHVRATPWGVLLAALAATLASYGALIGYDWSALRYIGKPLPLPTVALGGFLGYAFGNTIGAGAISGGAVRYRIYSSMGLTGYDIAGVALFASLAYGLGATIIGFGALLVHPAALASLTSLNPHVLRWISGLVLIALIGVLATLSIRRASVEWRGIRLDAPSPGLMSAQLGFTVLDMALAGCALYLLLPPNDLGFAAFMAVFAAAMMAGVLSHVPGGVGVFESVIIAALPAGVPIEQAAAGLLLFRLTYYLVPFGLALLTLALVELRMAMGPLRDTQIRDLAPIFKAVSSIVPLAMSAMIFASGVYMLFSAVIPALTDVAEEMELLMPLAMIEGGALLSSIVGAALIVLAHGLLRRVEGAWWLATASLAGGVAAALLNGWDLDRAGLMLLALLILLPCRREFYRSARLTRDALSPRWILLMSCVLLATLGIFFFSFKATPYAHELWWQFAVDERAPRSMRAGLVGSIVVALWALIYALRPPRPRQRPTSQDEIARALAVIDAQDNPDANFALTGDKCLLFSSTGRSFLMYGVQGRSWIALGDPVGDPDEADQLAWDFFDAASAANARPVFYEASARFLPLWIEMGLSLYKMGEEAIVPLSGFNLEGGSRKRLRTTANRARRDGMDFHVIEPPAPDAALAELKRISDDWLDAKNSREKQFSVGRFDADYLRRSPIAVVTWNGSTVGFANILATATGKRATIDLMRHTADAPGGMMEFLFIELILYLRDRGFEEFSLGMAPLAGLDSRRGGRWTTRMGALVYRHGRHFYNFEGLRQFKDKFDPQWQAKFLVVPPRANVLLVAADAAALIGGGLRAAVTKRG
ncbi:hypothetical protein BV394_04525 [Brevirhabdus pacifica]|uniref:Phosphatidylglycerol lysyltransferase n=1 Tax=Brevirhabdus pacifica TaxID=1267768 RepID=A0A1U7DGL1_9RHOB|nr:bifunctional lysylphosphatidylglycerol flippase/synthetase MprF [Brevirhabdus pacifica]APX89075.1 hypothetical protein BV394_04525 [Brevirhabdus pacifica]OWU76862.1 hypothetical protein ATO5_11765 [Loktanella sp. 22II-4b]PJJ86347.1 phosphatidylglycerol lysyltransferase [Brevirhabdus pacifica]